MAQARKVHNPFSAGGSHRRQPLPHHTQRLAKGRTIGTNGNTCFSVKALVLMGTMILVIVVLISRFSSSSTVDDSASLLDKSTLNHRGSILTSRDPPAPDSPPTGRNPLPTTIADKVDRLYAGTVPRNSGDESGDTAVVDRLYTGVVPRISVPRSNGDADNGSGENLVEDYRVSPDDPTKNRGVGSREHLASDPVARSPKAPNDRNEDNDSIENESEDGDDNAGIDIPSGDGLVPSTHMQHSPTSESVQVVIRDSATGNSKDNITIPNVNTPDDHNHTIVFGPSDDSSNTATTTIAITNSSSSDITSLLVNRTHFNRSEPTEINATETTVVSSSHKTSSNGTLFDMSNSTSGTVITKTGGTNHTADSSLVELDTNGTATTPSMFNKTREEGPVGNSTVGTAHFASMTVDQSDKIGSSSANHTLSNHTNSTFVATSMNVSGDSNSSTLDDEPSSLGSNRTNGTTSASRHESSLEIHHHTKPIRSSGTNSTNYKHATVVSSKSTHTKNGLVNTTFTDIEDTNGTAITPTMFNSTGENESVGNATNDTALLSSTAADRKGGAQKDKISSSSSANHTLSNHAYSTLVVTPMNVSGDSNSSTLDDEPSSLGSNRTNGTASTSHHDSSLEIPYRTKPIRQKNSTTFATTHYNNVTVTLSNSTNTTNDLANTTFAEIYIGNDTALLIKPSKKRKEKRREKLNATKENNVEILEKKHASAHDQKSFLRGKSTRMDNTTNVQ